WRIEEGAAFVWPVYVAEAGVGTCGGSAGLPVIAARAGPHSFSALPSSDFFSEPQPAAKNTANTVKTPAILDTVTSPGRFVGGSRIEDRLLRGERPCR